MAKIRMTPKRKLQARKYRQLLSRQTLLNFIKISAVFKDFGEETESVVNQAAEIDAIMSIINFEELERSVEKVLKVRGSLTIGRTGNFVNSLFGMNLNANIINTVRNKSIEEYHVNVDKLIKGITDTTEKQISIIVRDGQAKGKNINVIAKEINEKFENNE